MSITVNCPTCQKEVIWSKEYLFKPFCSERCKLIDLGDWAKEKNVIAGKTGYINEALAPLDDNDLDVFKVN